MRRRNERQRARACRCPFAHAKGFEAAASRFYGQAAELADRVLHAMSLALRLPPHFFAPLHAKRDLITLRMLHYPPVGDAATPADVRRARGRVRAGEHTDFGAITLLFVDAGGGAEAARGLQVRRPHAQSRNAAANDDGSWLDVEPEAGTVIVNTGGLLARWTNDAWVATAHRVVVTDAALSQPRHSIALFVDPDAHVLVECLPAFCAPSEGCEPARYVPITSEAYLLAKLAEAQQRRGDAEEEGAAAEGAAKGAEG
jgi:isopenicillin N synthase-like dioxygenase